MSDPARAVAMLCLGYANYDMLFTGAKKQVDHLASTIAPLITAARATARAEAWEEAKALFLREGWDCDQEAIIRYCDQAIRQAREGA